MASRHDTHDKDLADGINDCIHKGGQNSATADISWGGYKITELTAGTAATDAANYGQTITDLFENFGVPTRIYKLPGGLTVYAYHSERVVRDWARQFFYYCDLQFDTIDGYVVAWNSHGNQCALISEPDEIAVYGNEFDRLTETNFLDYGYDGPAAGE